MKSYHATNKKIMKYISLLFLSAALLYSALSFASEYGQIKLSGESDLNTTKLAADAGIEVATNSSTTLLTTLPLEKGNVVEFWEVSDGEIVIAEGGRYPSSPSVSKIVSDVDDVLEIYRRLAPPDAVIPKQLRKAAERERLMREYLIKDKKHIASKITSPAGSAMSKKLSASAGPLAAVDTSKCPWSWFDNQFSLVTQGPADPDNWSYQQRTGTTSYLNGRMSIVLASACSYRGNIRFSFWSKPTSTVIWLYDSPSFTRVVHAGEWYWVLSRSEWWWQNARDIYSEVSYAGGDGYHHKGVGCDRKAFSQCAVNAPNGHGYWGE